MTDKETFATRWSRLKRERATQKTDADPGHKSTETVERSDDETTTPTGRNPPDPVVDLASLPSIDSIDATSDIRAFLQRGVPSALTNAALRKVWAADPAIRDFIGLAENQWDFTDPTAMPGFGPLADSDDLAKLVAQAMGRMGDVAPPDAAKDPVRTADTPDLAVATAEERSEQSQHSGLPEQDETPPLAEHPGAAQELADSAATQQNDRPEHDKSTLGRRKHGGALPT